MIGLRFRSINISNNSWSIIKQRLPLTTNMTQIRAHSHSHTDDKPCESSTKTSDSLSPSETSSHAHTHDEHSHDHTHSLFGHSHSHSGPNELLSTSADALKNPAVRITWIGLLVNIGMAASKGFGGIYFHSQSLLADAIHSVSDMVADFLTLATVNMATKIGQPTKFPMGYGKIETVGSLLVSSVLLMAGVSVGWSSILQIFEFTLPAWLYEYAATIQLGHSHSHAPISAATDSHAVSHSHSHSSAHELEAPLDVTAGAPALHAAWLAGGSIVIKEILFKKTMQIANATNSKVLVANAWHHRVDSLTSIVALVTITGSHIFNIAWLDSVGGLMVSVLIIKTGWGSFISSWNDLVDRGEPANSELYQKVENIAKRAIVEVTDGDFEMSRLSVLPSGAYSNVYITLQDKTSKDYSVKQLNDLEIKIQDAIKKEDKFIKNLFIIFRGH